MLLLPSLVIGAALRLLVLDAAGAKSDAAAATREVRAAAKACACQIIEQSGSSSDCTTGACLAKLRSETGCDLVLATLVRRDGADLTVQLRLVDAIRGDVIHTA